MKSFLSLGVLALMLSLLAFTGVGTPRNRGQLVLQTKSGEITYKSANIPVSLDATGRLAFEFKPSSFRSGNDVNDNMLYRLMQEPAYRVLGFTGQLEQKIDKLKQGSSIKTAAVGKLKFAGLEQTIRVPATVSLNAKGEYIFSAMADIDWAANPGTQAIGKELQVTGPIHFSLTPTTK